MGEREARSGVNWLSRKAAALRGRHSLGCVPAWPIRGRTQRSAASPKPLDRPLATAACRAPSLYYCPGPLVMTCRTVVGTASSCASARLNSDL